MNEAFAIVVLLATLVGTLWGGCFWKPERILPSLILVSPLLLPPYRSFHLPGWDLDRISAVTMPALLLLPLVSGRRWRELRFHACDAFLLAFVVWSVVACAANKGSKAGAYRGLWLMTEMVTPLLVGRLCFSRDEDLRRFVKAFWWLPVLLLSMAVVESVRAPTFAPILYGESGPQMPRGSLFRPPVFTRHSLELGNFVGVLAIVLGGSLRCGFLADDRGLRTRVTFGFVGAVLTVLVTLSRGPLMALGLGLLVPLLLRRTALLNAAIGAAGVGLFYWMMSPAGSGLEVGMLVASGSTKLAENLLFRFQQIDVFKTVMTDHALLGWGETWPRLASIRIIDGQLLLHTLGTGFVGSLLIALYWITACYRVGRGTHERTSHWHWIGAGASGVLGFLVFSAWGDSFLRSQHFLLIGAIPAALERLRRPAVATAEAEVRVVRFGFG